MKNPNGVTTAVVTLLLLGPILFGLRGGAFSSADSDEAGTGDTPSTTESSPFLVIDGRPLSVEDYGRFLLETEGLRRLDEFVERELLRSAARGAKLSLPYEEIDARVQERVDRIRRVFPGDREGEIALAGTAFRSEAEYRRCLEQKLLWEAVADLLSTAETKGEGDDESESEVVPSKELRRAYLRSLREKAEVDRAGAPDALRSYLGRRSPTGSSSPGRSSR